MLVIKYFYMYPLAGIIKQFPKLKDPVNQYYTSIECGIHRGWVPPMADAVGRIHPIEMEYDDVLTIRGIDLWFDKRLGDILTVDTEKTTNCYFLNYDGDEYTISHHRTSDTIGGITNRPPPPIPKKINRLRAIAGPGKKGEFMHGNMGFSD